MEVENEKNSRRTNESTTFDTRHFSYQYFYFFTLSSHQDDIANIHNYLNITIINSKKSSFTYE